MNEEPQNDLARMEALEASNAALYMVVIALIQSHPRFDDFQLGLASILEMELGQDRSNLTAAQKATMREIVEGVQRVQPLPAGAIQRLLPRQSHPVSRGK